MKTKLQAAALATARGIDVVITNGKNPQGLYDIIKGKCGNSLSWGYIILVVYSMCKETARWISCPVCKNKTRNKMRADTEMKNFPLYCPKCRNECLIDVKEFHVQLIQIFK